ncbi:MAG: DUF2851 family protein [Pseudoflavonifractor sp.]|nr:DUF2851 family protein [Alloprevotella sp.]MCM1115939.1 DUF2851 family protein [Pseudoflavonifractor sp.]
MEMLMQYAWEHRLLPPGPFTTVDGLPLRIIDPGRRNHDAGPDFFNARIDIAGHHWAGNVEIHVKASDWHRHHHDGDPAYDSVILHVVESSDTRISRSDGQTIPQMVLPRRDDLEARYHALVDRADLDIPCASVIAAMEPIHRRSWLTALAFERLYAKEERFLALLSRLGGDYETATFVTVARGLGFSVNADPFERLALSVPLNVLGKHADSPLTIEAILFGQSGLLDEPAAMGEPYAQMLMKEYSFMIHKFGLKTPVSLGWKMSRMRPANFPHRRIAALAAMISGGFRMHSRILHAPSAEQARALFTPALSPYWQTRFTFGGEQSSRPTASLSRASADIMVINVAVPVIHAYAVAHGDEALVERSVEILQSIPPERNHITEAFARAGLRPDCAFDSQAIIQLRKCYCLARRCLACRFGHYSLSRNKPQPQPS